MLSYFVNDPFEANVHGPLTVGIEKFSTKPSAE